MIDLGEEDFDTLLFTLADLNTAIEVRLLIHFSSLDLTLYHRVVGGVNVVINRRLDLLHLKRRQEAIVNAILERVSIDGLAEVGVGVHIVPALGCRCEAELHGGREVFQNAPPSAFIIRAAPMTLVDHDEVEEVRRIFSKIRRFIRTR